MPPCFPWSLEIYNTNVVINWNKFAEGTYFSGSILDLAAATMSSVFLNGDGVRDRLFENWQDKHWFMNNPWAWKFLAERR